MDNADAKTNFKIRSNVTTACRHAVDWIEKSIVVQMTTIRMALAIKKLIKICYKRFSQLNINLISYPTIQVDMINCIFVCIYKSSSRKAILGIIAQNFQFF